MGEFLERLHILGILRMAVKNYCTELFSLLKKHRVVTIVGLGKEEGHFS